MTGPELVKVTLRLSKLQQQSVNSGEQSVNSGEQSVNSGEQSVNSVNSL